MKKKKVVRGNFEAYCPKRKQWFSWYNWKMEDLKKLCDQEGLIKFKKI